MSVYVCMYVSVYVSVCVCVCVSLYVKQNIALQLHKHLSTKTYANTCQVQ